MFSKITPTACDAVLFDIDNVLIDTRHSYLDAIRWTVEIYLTESKIPHFRKLSNAPTPFLLSPQDVDQFKLLGGFNDDWDCCFGLLTYLLSVPVKKRDLADLKKRMNLKKFIASTVKRPLGITGISKAVEPTTPVQMPKIQRIFQEVYLGKELFELTEKRRPLYWKKRGLIYNERPVFRKSTLEHLKQLGLQLGIATGRPFFEAEFILKQFDLLPLFDAITTIDDVRKAEAQTQQVLRKPDPYSLLKTAEKIGLKKRFLYVGDLPDDILAANRAKKTIAIQSVGFASLAREPKKMLQEIVKAKPDFVMTKPAEILGIVKGKKKTLSSGSQRTS